MIGGINYASSQIASIYNSGSQQLAATLTRLASGKKFQGASDDLVGFLRAQNMQVDISGYEQVRENLTDFKAYTSAAVVAGSSMFENLTKMKDLATKYAAASTASDDALMAQYSSEFNSLKAQVGTTLSNTFVDGILVTDATAAATKSVALDSEGGSPLTLTFTDTIPDASDITGMDLTAATPTDADDVQDQIDNILTYLSEAKGYDGIVDQQLNVTNTVINSKKAVLSLITDIDEAEELNNATDQSIRQQAAMSMLAQANMSRQAVLKLYM